MNLAIRLNSYRFAPRAFAKCLLLFLSIALLAGMPAYAQEGEPPKALDAEAVASIDAKLQAINENLAAITSLEQRAAVAESPRSELLKSRVRNMWASALDDVNRLADEIADQDEAGYDVAAYIDDLKVRLRQLPKAIEGMAPDAKRKVSLPDSSLSAVEIAMADEQMFAASDAFDDGSWALKRSIDAAERLGLDTKQQRAYLGSRATEKLDNASVLMDIAMRDAAMLAAAAKALPDDVEVKAKRTLAETRISRIAAAMENNIPLLEAVDIPTTQYRQQLVAVTGKVSADALDATIISNLVSDWTLTVTETIKLKGPAFLFQLLIVVLIVLVARKLAGIISGLVERGLSAPTVQASSLLKRMAKTISYNVVLVVGVLIALSQIGISLGPVLTGLGIAGFILGFALQDSLSNFASGMLILVYRPYDVGDMVEVSGVFGTVERMSLVNTTILTLDNQTLIVPNNKIWQDVIKNLTYQKIRRVDMTFGITYDQDIDVAIGVLREVTEADERVLEDPELNIRVHELGDSSVNLICRPWVQTDDYWDVYWDITKKVKQRFDEVGITIPFPQRDVHLFAGEPATQSFVDSVGQTESSRTKQIDNDEPSAEDDG